ncbi:MAG: ATP-binding protein [Defluviitaleaceae bacterium]|nr:ATP-binding protein [Defluviitaleaceae bacterium]
MKKFINREWELSALNEQFMRAESSLFVIYGRRRIGKTTLIAEFIKDKKALYFLADKETETQSQKRFAGLLAEYTGQSYLRDISFDNWRVPFEIFAKHSCDQKKVLVIDELPYMVETNPAIPSILQGVWDTLLKDANVMFILCGSLVHMMEKYALNYASPLYGRRSGQLKLRQIEFAYYAQFYPNMPYRGLVEHYAVTGGVPRYIELFDGKKDLFDEIHRLVLQRDGLLYEEPEFLLRHEVEEIGSYFSIIKSIAAGNHKAGKICADIGIKQTSLPKYLKTLTDLDIIERQVPVTEANPEKSKRGLYFIKDNFLRFWFRFIYPERGRLELGQTEYVLNNIKNHFIDSHTAHIYENVCMSEMWRLNKIGRLSFNKLGRWWDGKEEIDIVGLDGIGNEIIFAECKYRSAPIDVDVFYDLKRKAASVHWHNDTRHEKYVLFSISGYSKKLVELASAREDLVLFEITDHGHNFIYGY